MDLIGEERGRLARAASWLDATPAEVTGLAVLLVCAVVATGVLVWSALGRPALDDPGAAANGAAAEVGAAPGAAPDDGGDGARSTAVEETPATDDGGHGDGDGHGGGDDGGEVAASGEVTVHVAGAVADPGVVTLPVGSRVTDAVAAAGGLLDDADPSRINLARPLEDGEQLLILREGEDAPPAAAPGGGVGGGGGAGADATEPGPVDLNTASSEQLQTLPGIGPALADRILAHREQHGPFQDPGDLRDVSGIGEKRFQDLADLVTVG